MALSTHHLPACSGSQPRAGRELPAVAWAPLHSNGKARVETQREGRVLMGWDEEGKSELRTLLKCVSGKRFLFLNNERSSMVHS